MIPIADQVVFKCTVGREVYYSSDTCYGVYNVRTTDNIPGTQKITVFDDLANAPTVTTITGKMQRLVDGAEYEVVGRLTYNERFKKDQYQVEKIIPLAPKTKESTKLFLTSVLTDNQADTLLAVYPDIVNEVISGKDSVDVSKLKGIGEITWAKIKEKIINNFVLSDVIELLKPFGVTQTAILSMLKCEPNPSLLKQKIEDDPYWLSSLRGFGFKRTDQIALKLNPKLINSKKRAVAFLKEFLNDQANSQGNTYLLLDDLRNKASTYIPEAIDEYDNIIETEKANDVFLHVDGDKVGLKRYYNIEKNIFNSLLNLEKQPFSHSISEETIQKIITHTEQQQGFKFSEEQIDVINGSFEHNIMLMTGSAGTGKSSISRAILNVYKSVGCSIAACSLSAKAAGRITEATGFKATTIHRLLGAKGKDGGGFTFNKENPLDYDVIFVDETSMVNCDILNSLVEAIRYGSRVIFVGDAKQLPPIGAGSPFSDLLDNHIFNSYRLKTVHRQALDSGILADSLKIRNGEYPMAAPASRVVSGAKKDMMYSFREDKESMRSLVVKRFFSAVDKFGEENVMVLVPRKANCINCTSEINNDIQKQMFAGSVKSMKHGNTEFKLGARVIQLENNPDKNVYNSEIGYVHDLDARSPDGEECMTVKFKDENGNDKFVGYEKKELDQITLGYAITAHRSQGSEWQCCIVIIDETHYTLLSREILYTAITRAKEKCLLVATPSAFRRCVSHIDGDRNTWMKLM